MSVLASYERYMSTYILSEYVILFLLLVRLLARKKVDVCTYPVALGMLGIGLLMAGTGGVSQLMPQMFCEKDGDYKVQADEIQRLTPADTEVFLISSHNDVYTYILTYYLDDRRIDKRYLTSNVATWGADNTDYWNAVLNCIREDGYVYLYNGTGLVCSCRRKWGIEIATCMVRQNEELYCRREGRWNLNKKFRSLKFH